MTSPLLVAVDVGSRFHQVAVGDADGRLINEFRIDHSPSGFSSFRRRQRRGQVLRFVPPCHFVVMTAVYSRPK